jgi:hypothetical protein
VILATSPELWVSAGPSSARRLQSPRWGPLSGCPSPISLPGEKSLTFALLLTRLQAVREIFRTSANEMPRDPARFLRTLTPLGSSRSKLVREDN